MSPSTSGERHAPIDRLCCTAHTQAAREHSCLGHRWELIEVYKKVLLVGVLALISPGTMTQLILGQSIAFLLVVVTAVTQPYKHIDDDIFATMTGVSLVGMFMFALVVKIDAATEENDELRALFSFNQEAKRLQIDL